MWVRCVGCTYVHLYSTLVKRPQHSPTTTQIHTLQDVTKDNTAVLATSAPRLSEGDQGDNAQESTLGSCVVNWNFQHHLRCG